MTTLFLHSMKVKRKRCVSKVTFRNMGLVSALLLLQFAHNDVVAKDRKGRIHFDVKSCTVETVGLNGSLGDLEKALGAPTRIHRFPGNYQHLLYGTYAIDVAGVDGTVRVMSLALNDNVDEKVQSAIVYKQSPEEVRGKLGEPDVKVESTSSLQYIYHYKSCCVSVEFDPTIVGALGISMVSYDLSEESNVVDRGLLAECKKE